ncbi:MAG TPA: DEAD/DEAH box helicase, partial [Phycisphaerales bacterium]|nr:DEAD/DEAH box helicase [Phycisphaerales bacterium]
MTQMMMPDAGAEPDHTHTTPNGQQGDNASEGGQPRRRRRRRRGKGRSSGETPAATHADNHDNDAPPRRSAPARQRGIGADTTNPEVFDQETSFDTLGLSEPVLRGLHEAGFQRPTYIQAKLIPAVLTGRDVLGQAKTGTGKTAAFGLPLLHMVTKGAAFSALILAPTRELAVQITEEINQLGRHTGVTAVTVYGGQRIQTQVDKLNRGPEIIVGTPGRIFDMVDRGHLHFKNVRFAVLDEVDRMLDIGFREDIRRILSRCPAERQTVVVSATIGRDIEDLARRYMRNPEKIVTTAGSLTASMVEQHYLAVAPWDKKKLLLHLLKHEEPALTLVFCRLKRTVDELARYLNAKGVETHAMHGDMSQSKRTATMRKFKEGELAVLIASDLASRGIDVDGISHVVNYDLPEDPDLYVHRIGRTARAGRTGVAWAFVTPEQGKLLTQIERLVNAEIPRMDYPDFTPSTKPDAWRPEPT